MCTSKVQWIPVCCEIEYIFKRPHGWRANPKWIVGPSLPGITFSDEAKSAPTITWVCVFKTVEGVVREPLMLKHLKILSSLGQMLKYNGSTKGKIAPGGSKCTKRENINLEIVLPSALIWVNEEVLATFEGWNFINFVE